MQLIAIEGSRELMHIQTPSLKLTFKSQEKYKDFTYSKGTAIKSELKIISKENYELSLAGEPIVHKEDNLAEKHCVTVRMQPLFFEQQDYEIVIIGDGVEFYHESSLIRNYVSKISDSNIQSGIINFKNEIGYSDIVIKQNGVEQLRITIEVFPSKINYQEDYQALISDITDEVYNLVFDYLRRTYQNFELGETEAQTLSEYFTIIRTIFDQYIKAINMLMSKPHHVLDREYQVLPNHKVKRTDSKSIKWIQSHPQNAIRRDDKVYVDRALSVKKFVNYDTKENRIAKYIMMASVRKLELFKNRYSDVKRETDQEIIKEIDGMISCIRSKCSTGIMKYVIAEPSKIGMSLVFNMAPGYKELFKCYLMLQKGLVLTGELFKISCKDLAVLYEYWCFIKLNKLMKNNYSLVSQDIIKLDEGGLTVTLSKGQKSSVVYYDEKSGDKITLQYNCRASEGATVAQKPDNILKLEKENGGATYQFIFDAKYKIDETDLYCEKYGSSGPQEADINTMHRYRDAIVENHGHWRSEGPFERTMFGAYVLFPYTNEEEYRNHHFYKSIDRVNIGGLPFLPSATEMVSTLLDELITDSSASAFERATLPVGIEKQLAKVDWERKDVLIGRINNASMLEKYISEHYYDIEVNEIDEDRFPLYYVALFDSDRGIKYWGDIRYIDIINAKDETGNSKECYRFRIKKWNELKNAIEPKEFAPSPVGYTNQFLLTNSRTYPELYLRSKSEYRLYHELLRRCGAVSINLEEPKFEIDGIKVLLTDGEIKSFNNDGIVHEHCTIDAFSRNPSKEFRKIARNLINR